MDAILFTQDVLLTAVQEASEIGSPQGRALYHTLYAAYLLTLAAADMQQAEAFNRTGIAGKIIDGYRSEKITAAQENIARALAEEVGR